MKPHRQVYLSDAFVLALGAALLLAGGGNKDSQRETRAHATYHLFPRFSGSVITAGTRARAAGGTMQGENGGGNNVRREARAPPQWGRRSHIGKREARVLRNSILQASRTGYSLVATLVFICPLRRFTMEPGVSEAAESSAPGAILPTCPLARTCHVQSRPPGSDTNAGGLPRGDRRRSY